MPSFREFFIGPWRAVAVLGVTQILAWGAIFYTPVLILPLIAEERGFSLTFAMGGFSAGLLAAGFVAPTVGALIDRYGGHCVMPFGSLAGAAGLVAMTYASHPAVYVAVWVLLGAAMAASLYDPAFATLGRIFGARARQPITVLTLAGGFASTVSWPVTYALLKPLGWHGTYLFYAALLAFVAAPLHAFALPRTRATDRHRARRRGDARAAGPSRKRRCFPAARRGVLGLCLYPLRSLGASARNPAARRDGRRNGCLHRHAVWPLPSRRAPVRVHLRAQHPPVDHRTARRGPHGAGVRAAVAVRDFGAGRNDVCDHVRCRQRADHHCARRCAARAVRARRLRPHRGAHRAAVADHHGARPAGHGVRRRALVRSGGTCRRCCLCARRIRLLPRGAPDNLIE